MYVHDLEAAKDFFVRFFGGTAGEMYHNPKTGLKSYFLSFGQGARLEIMSRPETADAHDGHFRAGYIHISFKTGSKEAVDSLTKTLAEHGYKTLDGPRTTGDGYYESCIAGPENNLIEVTE